MTNTTEQKLIGFPASAYVERAAYIERSGAGVEVLVHWPVGGSYRYRSTCAHCYDVFRSNEALCLRGSVVVHYRCVALYDKGRAKYRRPRDAQRRRLYVAEREFWRGQPDMYQVDVSNDFTQAAAEVLASHFKLPVRVQTSKATRWSRGGADGIKLAIGAAIWIVPHEVAHCIQMQRHDWRKVQSHGREFVGLYVECVRVLWGVEIAVAFSAHLRARRIKGA